MKIPAVAASLKEIGVNNAFQLVANYMMDHDQLRKFVKGVKPLHDDRPVVEFSAPRIGKKGVVIKGKNLTGLLRYRKPPTIYFASAEEKELFGKYFESQSLFFAGQVRKSNGENSLAASHFNRSLRLSSDNQDARYANITLNLTAINSAIVSGRVDLGLRMVEDTKRLDKKGQFVNQLHFLSGMLFARGNKLLDAEKELKAAISKDEEYFLALVNLAGLYVSGLNRPDEAERLYRKALLLNPTKAERMAVIKALEGLKVTRDESFSHKGEARFAMAGGEASSWPSRLSLD
jgi:tetratricopeptide (TPR) repeat protein